VRRRMAETERETAV